MSQATSEQLREASSALEAADTADLRETGDLSGAGCCSSACEAAAAALPDDGPAAELLGLASATCDWIIMENDAPAVTDATSAVAEWVEAARRACDAEPVDAEMLFADARDAAVAFLEEAVPDLLAGRRGPEATAPQASAGGLDIESVPVPKPDAVSLTGDEDSIVYTEFINEAMEHLETIEVGLVDLENDPANADMLNAIFRCFHSIKGAAGFLGLSTMNALCHELETLLDRARKLTLAVDTDVISVVLKGVDVLKELMGNLQILIANVRDGGDEEPTPPDIRPVVAAVRVLLERPPETPGGDDDGDIDPSRLGGRLVAGGVASAESVEKALSEQKRPLGKILVDMGAASPEAVEETARRSTTAVTTRQFIKVDTEKLDNLMEMTGELVIAQSQVEQDRAVQNDESPSLSRNVRNLAKITRGLQDMVMAIRMVPLRQTFQKMHRLVRDTARKTGKEARLRIEGEETEIDKTVIEEIADPLVHLLRNAVDHGIDPPDEREADGKPREGRVDLTAYHHGGNVVIEVSDDGRGLDRDAILAKAVEKGLADPGRNYSESEIFEFVMGAGFSTAKQATDISGRGVGMDVVRRNIEKLGGRIEIKSERHEGSTFTVRLPMTMAIMDGMIVRVGEDRYVIPTLSIDESIHPDAGSVKTVSGKGEVVMVRNELIRLVRLADVFDIDGGASQASDGVIVVIHAEDEEVGVLVDDILGQQQVVIKSMGDTLRGLRGVSGACILGDGRVALILDAGGLLEVSRGG